MRRFDFAEQHPYEPYGRGLLGTMVVIWVQELAGNVLDNISALGQLFKSFAHSGNQILSAGNGNEEEQNRSGLTY